MVNIYGTILFRKIYNRDITATNIKILMVAPITCAELHTITDTLP